MSTSDKHRKKVVPADGAKPHAFAISLTVSVEVFEAAKRLMETNPEAHYPGLGFHGNFASFGKFDADVIAVARTVLEIWEHCQPLQ